LIKAIDSLLATQTHAKGRTMSTEDKIELFGENWPAYQEEARQRWGDTEDYKVNQEKIARMSPEDIQAAKQNSEDFKVDLGNARAAGIAPGTEKAQEIVDKHLATISPYMPMTRSKQVILARMYVADDRFAEAYGDNCQYLLDLVEAQASVEGIDVAN